MVFTTINRRETSGFVYANVPTSKARRRAGAVMSAVAILFLLFDGLTKVMGASQSAEASVQLGFPAGLVPITGIILLIFVVAYAVPSTSVLGAILLTGYLGGAVATQLRVGNPLLTHTLFPIYVAVLMWGGLYLREERLRALVPLRR
jgi:DoxX-like family